MADFTDVVKEIKKTNSKLETIKTNQEFMLETDPNLQPAEGAAATEERREIVNRDLKKTALLERIAKAVEKGGLGPTKDKDDKKGGWSFGKGLLSSLIPAGMLAALPAILTAGLKTLGLGLIIGGAAFAVASAVNDGAKAWGEAAAGEWGTKDKLSAFIGGFLGGNKEGGFWNALKQAGKGAAAGMLLGVPFGPPGIIIGAILGAAVGGLLGWIGGQKIAEWVDGTVKTFRNILDLPELLTEEQKTEVKKENDKLCTQIDTLVVKIKEYKAIIASDSSTLQERLDARTALRLAEKEIEKKQDQIATNNRTVAASTLAAQDKILSENMKTLLEAQKEERNAQMRFNNAKSRLFWAELIHGKESDQYKEAMNEYTETESALTDRKAHVTDLKTQRTDLKTKRSELRTEIDKEHQTFMGDTRLFFKGEMEWQKTLTDKLSKGWSSMKEHFQKTANWIYTPGDPGGAGAAPTAAKIFGFELKWPKIEFPEWGKIKDVAKEWFKKNIFDPGSAGDATGAGTPMKIFGVELSFPTLDISYENLKERLLSILPEFLTDPVGFMEKQITEMTSWLPDWLGGEEEEMSDEERQKRIAELEENIAKKTKRIERQEGRLAKLHEKNPEHVAIEGMVKGIEYRYNALDKVQAELDALKGKQHGGPVSAGTPYLVGEGSMLGEIFVPDRAGTILSAGMSRSILNGGGMGGGANIVDASSIVNAPQSNVTMTSSPIINDDPIIRAVNASAVT